MEGYLLGYIQKDFFTLFKPVVTHFRLCVGISSPVQFYVMPCSSQTQARVLTKELLALGHDLRNRPRLYLQLGFLVSMAPFLLPLRCEKLLLASEFAHQGL